MAATVNSPLRRLSTWLYRRESLYVALLFVPPLLSLMRNRLLKGPAREVLVSYGTGIVDALAYFMRDPEEDVWIRRHPHAANASHSDPNPIANGLLSLHAEARKPGFALPGLHAPGDGRLIGAGGEDESRA